MPLFPLNCLDLEFLPPNPDSWAFQNLLSLFFTSHATPHPDSSVLARKWQNKNVRASMCYASYKPVLWQLAGE